MFCRVYILDVPYLLDRPFDYLCDDGIKKGFFVKVPFGRADKLRVGVVTELLDSVDDSRNIKPVHSKLDERFALTEQMCGLCFFLKEHTMCTFGEAVRCVIPPGALADKLNISYQKSYSLAISAEEAENLLCASGRAGIRSAGQRTVLSHLVAFGSANSETLLALSGVTSANLTALCDKGYITVSLSEKIRNPYSAYGKERDLSEIVLSEAQTEAYKIIDDCYRAGAPKCALLHGVTGSGKTKLIIKAIDACLDDGKKAIMLVPEIALTPQTVGIFCRRYGERVAVINSSLSAGERIDAWRRIRRGDVDLVIGTRSAIFAPLDNIGLIVIDEEHEHTYKSESDPKYHAREVASYLCGRNSSLLLLASATPSLESYYKAKCGIYTLVSLKERYGGAKLPDAVVVDMREELRLGNISPISDRLLRDLKKVYDKEEQAILFLNRRGYNSQISCKSCGEVITCPRCSVSLTYHTGGGAGKLMCHMCGYTSPTPKSCAGCGSDKLSFLGYGTQKVEAELSRYLSDMTVLRMDADTTTTKQSYDRMLDDFRSFGSDILLGTQMVAKGHDFPRVTLVGVILADTSLFVSDFRAAEKTFSLLTQVIGRAGRAATGGVAVIQTFSPKNEIIRLACLQDYEKFYEGEIAVRRELMYPPFCDIVTLTVTADEEGVAMSLARKLSESLIEKIKPLSDKLPFIVFGPFEAGVYKLNDKYRMRLVVKCRLNSATRAVFSQLLQETAKNTNSASISVDFNPMTV